MSEARQVWDDQPALSLQFCTEQVKNLGVAGTAVEQQDREKIAGRTGWQVSKSD